MPSITPGTIVKILILCFFVGWGLSYFDLTPLQLLRGMVDNIDEAFGWLVEQTGAIVSYILLGAVIVLPIWGLTILADYMKRRRE